MIAQNPVWLRYALTTVLLTLFFGLGFAEALVYQYDHALFLTTWDYAAKAFGTPAGAATYLASLWAEACSTAWVGALVSALLLTAAGVATGYMARGASDRWSLGYILVWILAADVFNPLFLTTATTWLLAVGWCWVWVQTTKARSNVAWMVVALAYLSGGIGAMIVVVAMVWARMAIDRRPILWMASVAIAAGLIPLAAAYLYGISITAAYGAGVWLSWWVVLFSVATIVVGKYAFRRTDSNAWVGWAAFGLVTVCGSIGLWGQNNTKLLAMMRIEQAAERGLWDEVIQQSAAWEKQHEPNRMLTFLRNTALCRQGRLLWQMFDLPQAFGPGGLFYEWDESQGALNAKLGAQAYQSAGLLWQAHRLTYEAMVGQGPTHYTLRHLAAYNRAFDRPKAAQRYEHLLGHSLRGELVPIALDRPAVGCDTLSAQTNNIIADLEAVVASDTTHKAALEYLTALYLSVGHTKGIAQVAHRWTTLYAHHLIPETVQQALLACGHDFTPSTNVRRQFERFIGELNRAKGDPRAISANLHNTYWFYTLCLAQGRKRS